MIVVTVFLQIMNPTEFRLVHNQKENCHYDHIPFNFKVNRKRFLYKCKRCCVCVVYVLCMCCVCVCVQLISLYAISYGVMVYIRPGIH